MLNAPLVSRILLPVLTLLALAGEGWAQRTPAPPPADLVLTGGIIHTADGTRPRAQAVAVREGRIIFVGSDAEAAVLVGPATRRIALDGRTVIPGFIDSHGHLPNLASALRIVDLVGTRSLAAVIERVTERAGSVSSGGWVQGRGWDQNEWADTRFPSHESLSAAVPDHPVYLVRVDSHAALVNRRAMELAGITRDTPDPAGGVIVRDPATGEATGVLVDAAMALVREVIPPEPREEVRAGVRAAQRELNRLGITAIHDAGVPLAMLDLYEEMGRAGELTVRNHVMIRESAEGMAEVFRRGPRTNIDGRHFLDSRAIKISIDGALGSRGAALLEPYSDDPGNTGLLLFPAEELQGVAVRALERGIQLNVHGIGDRGNRIILDSYEAALRERPVADHRFRVEHAQILHRHDIPRFAQLGVIPAMQAIHQSSDMPWAEARLGWTRLLGAYAWRSLLQTGVTIPGGSDFPVESANPLASFHSAVTRQNADHWPAGGWFPAERMEREEALLHMTLWGAHAAFREGDLGSITPGKLADLVVLSRDIMRIPAEQILETRVEMTLVGGVIVHEAPDSGGTR
jgi:predicted amidohydrolase YtcJ